ncbi:hypothetical protein Cni_G05352 [Canna indica]|uniref:RNA polymerase II subunit 5-mediating protein homolog n=1 Tax=Canna indica TaxID=4628 RepID=A0AAQ3Q366_9LILI|nr:hypothetical protein Cni_G05352 [Canna indica]
MGDGAKGTVTPLGSLFPPEEVQKATKRVEEAIAERQSELGRLQGFVSDNTALIQFVRSLPNELSHDIMVPFGGAAFFPGCLVHTNEFLVLLGEGYYAERSAKQTVDILQRRGKVLEAKVESLKATMMDLEAQAKFFNSTAEEAAEGLVEIREEYIEKSEQDISGSGPNSLGSSKTDNLQKADEDEEFARIMARIEELEKEEELENGNTSGDDDKDILSPQQVGDEDEDGEAGDEVEDAETSYSFSSSAHKQETSESRLGHKSSDPVQKSRGQEMSSSIISKQIGGIYEQQLTDQSSLQSNDPAQKSRSREMSSSIVSKQIGGISEQQSTDQSSLQIGLEMQFIPHAHSFSNSKPSISNEKSGTSPSGAQFSFPTIEDSSNGIASGNSNPVSSGRKAFTGSIVEHDVGLPPIQSVKNTTNQTQSASSSSPKPVSRFKMQRGNR